MPICATPCATGGGSRSSISDWRVSSLSVGGEVRAEYERLDHPGFGALPTDLGGYELARVMLHADWRVGSQLRVFGQIASAQEAGRTGGPRPTDVDTLDVRQAFAEFTQPIAPGRLWGRVGRQELVFGGTRLFATRDPANVRRSFDAVRVASRTAGCRGPVWGRQVLVGPACSTTRGTRRATRGGCSAR